MKFWMSPHGQVFCWSGGQWIECDARLWYLPQRNLPNINRLLAAKEVEVP